MIEMPTWAFWWVVLHAAWTAVNLALYFEARREMRDAERLFDEAEQAIADARSLYQKARDMLGMKA